MTLSHENLVQKPGWDRLYHLGIISCHNIKPILSRGDIWQVYPLALCPKFNALIKEMRTLIHFSTIYVLFRGERRRLIRLLAQNCERAVVLSTV